MSGDAKFPHIMIKPQQVKIKPYNLIAKIDRGKYFLYNYRSPFSKSFYSELRFYKSKYSSEELTLIDDLFNNLDGGNLAIIKGLLHSKHARKEEI